MVFWVCLSGVSWGQTHVFADKTWNNTNSTPNATTVPGGYVDGIIIYSNVHLTINDVSLVMNADKDIILQQGARLTLKSINQFTYLEIGNNGKLISSDNGTISIDQNANNLAWLKVGVNGQINLEGASSLNANGASITLEVGATLNINGGSLVTNQAMVTLKENASMFLEETSAPFIPSNWTAINSTYKFGQDSKVTGQHYDVNISLENSSFIAIAINTWKGISLKSTGPHSIARNHWSTPAIANNDGTCTAADWAGVVSNFTPIVKAVNCTFKNAEVALQSAANIFYDNGGPILQLNNCSFNNCKRGVSLEAYRKIGEMTANWIMTCDFTWDDAILFPLNDLSHVDIWMMGPVRIGGCNFKNDIASQHSKTDRGIGINVLHSVISLSKDGDRCCKEGTECPDNCFPAPSQSRRNTFENLGYGIRAIGGTESVNSSLYPTHPHFPATRETELTVRYSDFNNCIHSVYVENCLDAQIARNNFTIAKSDVDAKYPSGYSTSPTVKQVYLKNSSGIRIHDNVFSHDLYYIAGIVMEDPDQTQTSFIRKNTFTSPNGVLPTCGPQVKAIELYGNNDHLDITCNTFINHVYDVYLHNYASLNDIPDLDVYQGTNYKFNRNTWSELPTRTTPLPQNEHKWQTQGCASNVFIDVNVVGGVNIYHRYDFTFGVLSGHMKFDVNSYPKTNQPHMVVFVPNEPGDAYKYPTCGSAGVNDCVDCSTDCDKLGIKQVATLKVLDKLWNVNNLFSFYPNPSSNTVTIKLNQNITTSTRINIFDVFGKIVYSSPLVNRETTIDLQALCLQNGIFILQVIDKDTQSSSKLIYQKY